MTYISLKHRLIESVWSQDWPTQGDEDSSAYAPLLGAGYPPLPSRFPPEYRAEQELNHKIVMALAGAGSESISLQESHAFLDRLESFMEIPEVQQSMTYPPSAEGFAKALTQIAQHPEHGLLCMTLLQAFPEYVFKVFAEARKKDKQWTIDFPFAEPLTSPAVVMAPSAPAEQEVLPSAQPTVAAEKEKPARVQTPEKKVVFSEKQTKEAHRLVEKLIEILPINVGIPQNLISMAATAANMDLWSFFSGPLLSEITQRPHEEFKVLVENWPSAQRIEVQDPVEWMTRNQFWLIVKNTSDENRELFMKEGLGKMVDMDLIYPNIRLQMLSKMLPYASRNETLFKERINLWLSLGGNLDETCTVNENDSSLLRANSAREWIENSNNALWNEVMPTFEVKREISAKFKRSPALGSP